MKKTRLIIAVVFLFNLALLSVSNAGNYLLDGLDDDCHPSGIFSSVSLAWSPLKFWAGQYVKMDELRKGIQIRSIIATDCRGSDALDCRRKYLKAYRGLIKCISHSAKMCRKHGGYC